MAAAAADRSRGQPSAAGDPSLAVAIPTRSRPRELGRCLDSMAASQARLGFTAYVCDSSPTEAERDAVRAVCERFEWVRLSSHDGRNIAAARNACARAAAADVLVSVDDDLVLEPEAVDRLWRRYREGQGRRVVGGAVSWGEDWVGPGKLRAIGYGRPLRPGERADFIPSALFLYPRAYALAWPWNERIPFGEDLFMGAVWRRHGVALLYAEDARALHPALPTTADPARFAATIEHQRWHSYTLFFDAVLANPDPLRAFAYATLGFLASAKAFCRRPGWTATFLRSWFGGQRQLFADRRYLRDLIRKELPADAAL